MEIKILGTGCPSCQQLEKNTKQALADLKSEANVEKVTEIEEIMSYGVMSVPALVVDGVVLAAGMVLDPDQIKKAITSKKSSDEGTKACACKGKC
jgi:small redox-active disulfide protein 2